MELQNKIWQLKDHNTINSAKKTEHDLLMLFQGVKWQMTLGK